MKLLSLLVIILCSFSNTLCSDTCSLRINFEERKKALSNDTSNIKSKMLSETQIDSIEEKYDNIIYDRLNY